MNCEWCEEEFEQTRSHQRFCSKLHYKYYGRKFLGHSNGVKKPDLRRGRKKNYRTHKGDTCEECGFIPIDPCQLDVDHIDGNHSNNDPENLRTLCANCHRLKTKLSKEGIYK